MVSYVLIIPVVNTDRVRSPGRASLKVVNPRKPANGWPHLRYLQEENIHNGQPPVPRHDELQPDHRNRDAFGLMGGAREHGIYFFDTTNRYGRPALRETTILSAE
jgi:hypothetical protein